MAQRIITLTTDFGLSDAYVGSMKGAILSINPQALMIDISHSIRPQKIEQGAYVLSSAWPYFPGGSIHVAVVDPGVGTQRRAIALETPAGFFVGPDNGLLSAALPEEVRAGAPEPAGSVALPQGYDAVSLTNEAYFRHPVSATFHGRDIFGPVAAHISTGVPLAALGEPVGEIIALPPFRARRQADDSLRGRIIHIDRFGNLVTDVRAQDLPQERVFIEIADRQIAGLRPAYEGEGELVAVVGSAGYLEIAVPNGDAAAMLGADIGTPVIVRPTV